MTHHHWHIPAAEINQILLSLIDDHSYGPFSCEAKGAIVWKTELVRPKYSLSREVSLTRQPGIKA